MAQEVEKKEQATEPAQQGKGADAYSPETFLSFTELLGELGVLSPETVQAVVQDVSAHFNGGKGQGRENPDAPGTEADAERLFGMNFIPEK